MQIKSKTTPANNIVFWSLNKKVDIKQYGEYLQVLPTGNSTDTDQYLGTMLKHFA